MKTRYFDYDRFRAGFPAKTRDGKAAHFVPSHHDMETDYRVPSYMHVHVEGERHAKDLFYDAEEGTFNDISCFPVDRLDLFMEPFDRPRASKKELEMQVIADRYKLDRMEKALRESHDTFKLYQRIHLDKTPPDQAKSDANLMSARVCQHALIETNHKDTHGQDQETSA